MEKCKNKAQYVYPWGGKLMEACDDHSRAMRAIANAIGARIEFQSISNNSMCMHMDDLKN